MTDQYLQEEFIGKTFSDKLNNEMADYFSERKFTILGYLPRPGAIAMVHILDDGAIKEVGASDPFDIINSNYGRFLAGMHSPLSNSFNNPLQAINGLRNTGGGTGTTYYYNQGSNNAYNNTGNGFTQIQIGSGLTPPTINDFDIETAFPNAPESNKTTTPIGGYAPSIGRVTANVNIGPTVATGTINEMAIFMQMRGTGLCMLSHDTISPGVAFGIGETIFCTYFFQL